MNTSSNTALIWSDRFRLHDTAGYPEAPERIDALRGALEAAGMFGDRLVLEPEPASLEAVTTVHAPDVAELARDARRRRGRRYSMPTR